MPSTPLFPFAHGLSYTSFDYSQLELESDETDVSGDANASMTITNSGKRGLVLKLCSCTRPIPLVASLCLHNN